MEFCSLMKLVSVLFGNFNSLDELGKNQFGVEAITTLVEAMTSPEYEGLLIIMAGYPHDMDAMLARNAGLKSRFTNRCDFQNWSADDSATYLLSHGAKKGFDVPGEAYETLYQAFSELIRLPGWANARDVLQVWDEILQRRANRVCNIRGYNREILMEDVDGALEKMINSRQSHPLPPHHPKTSMEEEGVADELGFNSDNFKIPKEDVVENKNDSYDDDSEQKEEKKEDNHSTGDDSEQKEEYEKEEASGREKEATDSEWQELCEAIRLQRQKEEDYRKLLEDMEIQRLEAIRQANAEQLARVEREILARMEAERKLEEQRLRAIERLRQLNNCPAGFNWFKVGGGWRCGGGSHFVTDEQLGRQFTT